MSPLVLAGALGAVGLLLFGLDRLAGRLVRPTIQPVERTVDALGLPVRELTIESAGHQLQGWLIEPDGAAPGTSEADGAAPGATSLDRGRPDGADPAEPLVILAHGWGANHGVVLRLGGPLARRGHDVLLFDVRGHGHNPPVDQVTIRAFRDDVMACVRQAKGLFPHRPLVLIGHSMGGAAGVLAAAEGAPLDGLILIASPSDVLTVTAEYLTDHDMPGPFLVTILRPFFWRRIGGTFRRLTPSRRIRELDLPLLMIQPELDARVIRPHADRLAAAAGAPYHLIGGREHTDVLEAPETVELVEGFLEDVKRS